MSVPDGPKPLARGSAAVYHEGMHQHPYRDALVALAHDEEPVDAKGRTAAQRTDLAIMAGEHPVSAGTYLATCRDLERAFLARINEEAHAVVGELHVRRQKAVAKAGSLASHPGNVIEAARSRDAEAFPGGEDARGSSVLLEALRRVIRKHPMLVGVARVES